MSKTKEDAFREKQAKVDRYYKKAILMATTNKNLVFVQDISEAIGITSRSFNNYFPVGSDMYLTIMGMLEDNRTTTKLNIREKLLESKNATALIALYRLLGTIEEKNALVLKEQEDASASKEEKTVKLVIN